MITARCNNAQSVFPSYKRWVLSSTNNDLGKETGSQKGLSVSFDGMVFGFSAFVTASLTSLGVFPDVCVLIPKD